MSFAHHGARLVDHLRRHVYPQHVSIGALSAAGDGGVEPGSSSQINHSLTGMKVRNLSRKATAEAQIGIGRVSVEIVIAFTHVEAGAGARTVDGALHEAGIFQHLEVARHGGLGERQVVHNLATNALGAVGKDLDDRQPRRGLPCTSSTVSGSASGTRSAWNMSRMCRCIP